MNLDSEKTALQLPLKFSIAQNISRDDLIESPANMMAISMIDTWPDWPGKILALKGPPGCGKTHIASAWLELAGGVICQMIDIELHCDELVDLVNAGNNLVLDDANAGEIPEVHLFHLINAARQAGTYITMNCSDWPQNWQVALPDLNSRLRTVQIATIEEPDDGLLSQVMIKLFADRQLVVDEKVIQYCLLRMERSLSVASILVDLMDQDALSQKSAITRKIAGRALEQLQIDPEE